MPYKNTHDSCSNLSQHQDSDLTNLAEQQLSRRQFLVGTSAAGMSAFIAMTPLASAIAKTTGNSSSAIMGFEAVPMSTADSVVVPKGYQFKVLLSWGDPIFEGAPEFDPSGTADAASAEQQFGDNTDGMTFFPINENRAVMAINNEYINSEYVYSHQGESMTADDVKKGQALHGVTVVEIVKETNGWKIDKSGERNRRIHANTPMQMTGPAAGHNLLQTEADPSGTNVLGTFNNCANGQTPWGTYLTCEENFHGYFGTTDDTYSMPETHQRYGIKHADKRYQWSKFDDRFDIAKNPNEPNRFGWVVEIDPHNSESTPKKRTALGRFKHENAALVVDDNGHVVVYLGDDERGEHLYKFVSKGKYRESDDASNRELLTEGTLYVAKFNWEGDNLEGTGQWLPLIHGENGLTAKNGFAGQGEVLVKTRQAATVLGATTMDRPEWVAVHPDKSSACCTLTNNKNRGNKDIQPVGGPNPRKGNPFGQIVRWYPANGDHTSDTFSWDLFLMAGNPVVHKDNGLYAGSENINPDNMINSPDGIGFDAAGSLWILTDGQYSNGGEYAGMGNNQMLCADPQSGEVRRFLTGPVACEITGLTFSPDSTAMFVGVQHPGENLAASHFPGGGDSIPRSSVLVITKEDGGVIGS